MLTVAHRLHTIMDSDQVLVLDAGLVKEMAAPGRLLQVKHVLARVLSRLCAVFHMSFTQCIWSAHACHAPSSSCRPQHRQGCNHAQLITLRRSAEI